MALLVDYTQTRFGVPYNDAYLRIVVFTVGKPANVGSPVLAPLDITYHVYASQAAAEAEADAILVDHLMLSITLDDSVSFASLYEAIKPSFENPRDA